MENETGAEIVLKMIAANSKREEMTASVKRMLWRADNLNPLPRMKAFRLAQDFGHLGRNTGENARIKSERLSRILSSRADKKVVCYSCGAVVKPGEKECGSCGCKYKAFR